MSLLHVSGRYPLYAQPLSRILRLTLDDVLHQDNEVSIRLGDPPSPVPEPFADLSYSTSTSDST